MVTRNIALTLVVGAALTALVREYFPDSWNVMQTAGLWLMIAGFILWTVARFQLGGSFTVTAQAKRLVTRGLYSKIRNPIYVFGSWVVAGLILLRGRPIWLLIFAILIPLQIWRARKEAQVLESEFGEKYWAYRATTWF